MTRKRPREITEGMLVEYSVRGTVAKVAAGGGFIMNTQDGPVMVPGDSPSYKVVVPPHRGVKLGQVWQTKDGVKWFARISDDGLPFRLTPEDLTNKNGLKTLDESDFFIKYPDAKLIFPERRQGKKPGPLNLRLTPEEQANGYGHTYGEALRPATK